MNILFVVSTNTLFLKVISIDRFNNFGEMKEKKISHSLQIEEDMCMKKTTKHYIIITF